MHNKTVVNSIKLNIAISGKDARFAITLTFKDESNEVSLYLIFSIYN